MEQNIGLFSAKLNDLAEKATLMQRHIAELESADPDEVRRARAHLEAEWADVIVDLKNRAKAMRFLTGQQLSQVQLEYCRRAADILHDSLKTNWSAMAGVRRRATKRHSMRNMRSILQRGDALCASGDGDGAGYAV